jgi:two-component system NarL family sensor kinase
MPEKFSEVVLILVGSTFIILVLVVLVITALFINQKRKFRHKLELSNLRNEYDLELLQTQLEIQSQTFETISRELHDNVGTLLSIAMVHLLSEAEAGKDMPANITEVESLLNEAMDMLRDISKSLSPENITRTGWQQSFLNELERIDRSRLFNIQTSVSGVPFTMEDSKQIILFRILQEAMNNIVKHSEASNVNVNIRYTADELNIKIADDGKGMADQKSLTASDGAGLRNMKARAVMLPAAIEINSVLGNGTTIHIRYKQTG